MPQHAEYRRDRDWGALRRFADSDATGSSGSQGAAARSRPLPERYALHTYDPSAGIASLQKWGLLDRLIGTGCPAIKEYKFDFGFFTISGTPRPIDGVAVAYGPRRTILDKLLLDGAAEAGVEIRQDFIAEELLVEGDRVTGIRGHGRGGAVHRRALARRHRRRWPALDGGQGRSRAADDEKPPLQASYYTYWSNLPASSFEIYIRPNRGWGVVPTHDNLTLVVQGWPYAEFEQNKKDIEGTYLERFDLAPEFAERLGRPRARRRSAVRAVPSYFRKLFGAGWALVGVAGDNKIRSPRGGSAMHFGDADLCASALDDWLRGARPFDEAMADYQKTRDRVSEPLSISRQLLNTGAASARDATAAARDAVIRDAQDQFVSMMAGTLPVPAFFAPENVGRIMATTGAQAQRH